MRIDLGDRSAIVTGGSNGIGLAIARALAACGARVGIFDLEPPAVAVDAQFARADVADRASLENAFAQFGDVEIVAANAGTAAFELLVEAREETWRRILDVNLTGCFYTVQLAARCMKARRRGSIIVTASTNSYDGEASLVAYNATKAGVLGIVHTAANELGPYGIRVNAVCPGTIRTRLTASYYDDPRGLKEYFRQIPLGRGGEPEEVATTVVFLASDLSSYITGAALFVDGGQMAAKFAPWNEEIAEFEKDRWRLR